VESFPNEGVSIGANPKSSKLPLTVSMIKFRLTDLFRRKISGAFGNTGLLCHNAKVFANILFFDKIFGI